MLCLQFSHLQHRSHTYTQRLSWRYSQQLARFEFVIVFPHFIASSFVFPQRRCYEIYFQWTRIDAVKNKSFRKAAPLVARISTRDGMCITHTHTVRKYHTPNDLNGHHGNSVYIVVCFAINYKLHFGTVNERSMRTHIRFFVVAVSLAKRLRRKFLLITGNSINCGFRDFHRLPLPISE